MKNPTPWKLRSNGTGGWFIVDANDVVIVLGINKRIGTHVVKAVNAAVKARAAK